MLKQLGDDWRDGNASVVASAGMITGLILNQWHHEAKAKLLGNIAVPQHHVE